MERVLKNQYAIMEFLSETIAKEQLIPSMNETADMLFPLKEESLREKTEFAFSKEDEE